MKGLIIATQFLTRLPTPKVSVSEQEFAASIRWFPAVGILIGLIIAAAGWAGAHIDAWLGAIAVIAAWVLVTGGLHLDGLADIADASGAAHKDRARLLAVLADPHIGSFGVIAVNLQLIAKIVLVHTIIVHGLMSSLIVVPFAARIAPLVWARSIPALHDGLGARFGAAVRLRDLIVWALVLLVAAWFFHALLVLIPAVVLWRTWILRRIGGISGDGHGGGIELIETVLLLAITMEGLKL